jgi:ABC-type proline/glycine betaine transport system substrate-binding protein
MRKLSAFALAAVVALAGPAAGQTTLRVVMHSTDLAVLANLAPVAKSLMEQAGFKVDMHSMDWQTLVARRAKKDPPREAGTPSSLLGGG